MPIFATMLAQNSHTFYENVLDVVRLVPFGRVTTYGAVAAYLGAKRSARMVGYALNNCPSDVPAHRVVNRLGMLTGQHHFTPHPMAALLAAEGVLVEDNCIQDFEQRFWDPQQHLL